MRALVTGDAGMIGSAVLAALRGRGDIAVGFDKSRGEDLLDKAALEQTALGSEAVVHCAAIKNDSRGTPAEIFATNVTGTWNALRAAENAGARAFVYLSTAQVFGVFDPTSTGVDFPVSDDHPRRASRPYGLSKCFGEDLCAAFTDRIGITTVALRPVAVFDPPHLRVGVARTVRFRGAPVPGPLLRRSSRRHCWASPRSVEASPKRRCRERDTKEVRP